MFYDDKNSIFSLIPSFISARFDFHFSNKSKIVWVKKKNATLYGFLSVLIKFLIYITRIS